MLCIFELALVQAEENFIETMKVMLAAGVKQVRVHTNGQHCRSCLTLDRCMRMGLPSHYFNLYSHA